MVEKFYRTKDGQIVLRALPGVGIDRAVSFAHMHGYQDNGFPKNKPTNIDDDNIWASFAPVTTSEATL